MINNVLGKMNQYSEQYVAKTTQAFLLGIRVGLVSMLLALYNIYFAPDFPLTLALIGVLVTGLNETITINYSNKIRLTFTFAMILSTSLAILLGSYIHDNMGLSILLIVIFMFLVAFTARQEVPIAILFFLVADLIVVGNGLPVHSMDKAINSMLGYFYGAISIFVVSCIYDLLWGYRYKSTIVFKFRCLELISINKASIKFGVILSVAVLTSLAVAEYFHLAQGYWLPMTTLIVLKSEYDFMRSAVKYRLLGTLLGGVLSFPLAYYEPSQVFCAILLLPVSILIIVGLLKHYATYVTFLTILITILLNFHHHVGVAIIRARVFDTLISVGVVILIIEVLLPILNIRHAGMKSNT